MKQYSDDDWRRSRPISEDDRLVSINPLIAHYRNLWIEADFQDKHDEAERFKSLYEEYKRRYLNGVNYEPKF